MRCLLILAVLLPLALTACAGDAGTGAEGTAGAGEAASEAGGDAQPQDEVELTGTLRGDADLEGGCAWVDTDAGPFEVLWPQGYDVEFPDGDLVGPDGEVVASTGDTISVTGTEAADRVSICQVGTIFEATEVQAG